MEERKETLNNPGQIEASGISADYINELMSIMMLKGDDGWTFEEWCIHKKQNPIRTYVERYIQYPYENLVNKTNKTNLEKLDNIVRKLNLIAQGTLTSSKEEVIGLMQDAIKLIRGT